MLSTVLHNSGRVIFPSSQRGGCAIKRMPRSHQSGADGVVRLAQRYASSHGKDFLSAFSQPLTAPIRKQVRILHTDAPQAGIENLRLDSKNNSGLQRRIEFRSDHRCLIQFQTDTVRDKSNLIFASSHEVL